MVLPIGETHVESELNSAYIQPRKGCDRPEKHPLTKSDRPEKYDLIKSDSCCIYI
jgi:hypothetical protein